MKFILYPLINQAKNTLEAHSDYYPHDKYSGDWSLSNLLQMKSINRKRQVAKKQINTAIDVLNNSFANLGIPAHDEDIDIENFFEETNNFKYLTPRKLEDMKILHNIYLTVLDRGRDFQLTNREQLFLNNIRQYFVYVLDQNTNMESLLIQDFNSLAVIRSRGVEETKDGQYQETRRRNTIYENTPRPHLQIRIYNEIEPQQKSPDYGHDRRFSETRYHHCSNSALMYERLQRGGFTPESSITRTSNDAVTQSPPALVTGPVNSVSEERIVRKRRGSEVFADSEEHNSSGQQQEETCPMEISTEDTAASNKRKATITLAPAILKVPRLKRELEEQDSNTFTNRFVSG